MKMPRSALLFLLGVVFTTGLLTVGQATVAAASNPDRKTGDCVGTYDINKLTDEEYRQIYGG